MPDKAMVSTGRQHGRKSWGMGDESSEFEVGDANANLPPDFVMFQNFKHQIAKSLPTLWLSQSVYYFPKVHLQRPPNHHFRWKIQHFLARTRTNAPKHAVSSENYIFFSGRGPIPLPYALPTPHSLPHQACCIRPCVPQNSSQIYATGRQ